MKGIYIAMAMAAALLFTLGDSFWKYRFHGHMNIGFFELVKFWSLPTKILVAMLFSFLMGGLAKLITLYPLREADLSAFLPMVIIFSMLFISLSGLIIFKEDFTAKKIIGVAAALFAIYLLK
ncbi:MAG: hypothetical protein QME59_01570 [Candidatus Hydrothermarchaeota archaeon]|nr:hypothetical protein [Candidatus Hydrothermarchaeota archaeon]